MPTSDIERKPETLEDALILIEELRQALEAANAGAAGWMILCPNPNYSDRTAGVQFRAGRAFLPASPKAEELATLMRNDFGYQIRYVPNWRQVDELARSMQTSFADFMTGV